MYRERHQVHVLVGPAMNFCLADARGPDHGTQLHVDAFLDIKKTQLKGVKAEAVTSRKKVIGYRADGSQMVCTVQGVDKHGDGLRQVHLHTGVVVAD